MLTTSLPCEPSFIRKCIIAVRPYSLPASCMPVLFGTTLAVIIGGADFKPCLFLLSILAMMLLHSAANILNDVKDYNIGLDKIPTPVSGAVVRGYFSPKASLVASILLFAAGSVLGLIIAYFTGPSVIYIGIIGILIGVIYSIGPVALKYIALGDMAVFVGFGLLGSLGAWAVQTGGKLSWIPVIWSIPLSMIITGILHANNWRDMTGDENGGFETIASKMKDTGSLYYYGFLIFGSFAGIVLIIIFTRIFANTHQMPLTFLITFCALPQALKLWKKAFLRQNPESPDDFITLDGATGRFELVFGIFCFLALMLHLVVGG